ncbi:hypothetical protein Rhe02_56900 [Rhizocola hellebori]|uniref:Uncharacterized protein n=1 Tax=Rhizocola hellebori TaxID=1392758 RepID=A0A8J3QB70_9ACTN|nr:hypothetical protein [Rhizocola hellebori]GIH07623.1 hypothetical protein Rhe02_56900 [Rhizocola hellebori]
MDSDSEQLWLAFVQAEQAYREAMGALRRTNMEEVLREGLERLPWRRQALAVLGASNVEISERLLPELFELAGVSHSLIDEVRRCISRIPRDVLERKLPGFVAVLIANPKSDYEAYRRTAELLRLLEMGDLLSELVDAAAMSPDSDIREVAVDFQRG